MEIKTGQAAASIHGMDTMDVVRLQNPCASVEIDLINRKDLFCHLKTLA